MKKLVVKNKDACMACLSCVNACSQAFYKVDDPGKSCIQIVEKNGAVKVNTRQANKMAGAAHSNCPCFR